MFRIESLLLLSWLAAQSLAYLNPLQSDRPGAVTARLQQRSNRPATFLWSSFYNDFDADEDEEEEDEDDSDDDDEEDEEDFEDLDDRSVADFRTRMTAMFGDDITDDDAKASVEELISFARSVSGTSSAAATDWVKVAEEIAEGVVLLANPAHFCTDFGPTRPLPALLNKFGLTLPPPAELGPDRRADLLPVLVLVEVDQRSRGVLLNRRTGFLLGDLEQPSVDDSKSPAPLLEKFCIQPLWFGGVDNLSSGLDMLHQCPLVEGAKQLTEDGLYWGGDPSQAQSAMEQPIEGRVLTGFDFKFFVQATQWQLGELEREMAAGTWFPCRVSKEVLFKSRDRMGTQRAKPLWTECMELLGGEYKEIRDRLYGEEDELQ